MIPTINKRYTNRKALKQLHSWMSENRDLVRLEMDTFMCGEPEPVLAARISANWAANPTPHCGTSACAVGWSPTAGLTRHLTDEDGNERGWGEYSKFTFFNKKGHRKATDQRTFGYMGSIGSMLSPVASDLWDFMFGPYWADDVDLLLARLEYVILFDRVPTSVQYPPRKQHGTAGRKAAGLIRAEATSQVIA